ncbi:ribosomal protein L7/L12 [Cohnella boryungensis]|uniref:Ribosomal protein L7/L12 n=1 Tax=Cohnella boryungensis TaxID=768479 RepID=A0ABV8SJ14_9BACL
MQAWEIVGVAAIGLVLLLLIKVFSLQRQLDEVKLDLEWLRNRPERSGFYPPIAASASSPDASNAEERHDPVAKLQDRLRILVAEGKKIQAIKEYREARGVGLKEAKDYVDSLDRSG